MTISKNNYQGLQKTLQSVKEQDSKIIEHIVIDGESDDGSKELLKSYTHCKKYVYFSEVDNGISSAFNKGLDRINGD
ncbi:glycosyltransferase [Aetokthonos hydrillicola Thurmond2011]|uniref:Glycosyltransferase n=1 Tax=Aetokthonos hydrillicola Thurmond2011 TaxID=2712845 RepID=A0AAP5MB14_9CYAN|nr:glycosyltransferase [Aetokthonos hydrillicola]MBO3461943.1 glycosyltransferase [Aetokthonos hydrillicola CCALA 1050]MBW4589171.1 glycosyltransferase [Aetokthonos hydrillicola CCALA 1050]MDR9898730.1 glycosyltransferase [Aetokthonos hydrillicola Thurmond2011]